MVVVSVGSEPAADLTGRIYGRVHVRVRRTCPDRLQHLGEARRSGVYSLLRAGDDVGRGERTRDCRREGRAGLRSRTPAGGVRFVHRKSTIMPLIAGRPK